MKAASLNSYLAHDTSQLSVPAEILKLKRASTHGSVKSVRLVARSQLTADSSTKPLSKHVPVNGVPRSPKESPAPKSTSSAAKMPGLGIKSVLKNKKLLITGATGFLAKVLVEKILRTQPEVGHIFLMINSKCSRTAEERLEKEVQCSKLFQVLQAKHGDEFNDFFRGKVTAVAGNVTKDDLGLEPEAAHRLTKEVDIIVNSAATTNFLERYDVALNINTKGPLHLIKFAGKCSHLELFVHVSTAYVNGKRIGKALEEPFQMNESIARDSLGDHAAPPLDIKEEIELVQKIATSNPSYDMKQLGLQRAAAHGWQDTYVFTKAMGEMLLCNNRGDIPLVVFRPSVIEGTLNEPIPGWVEGIRMMDPILLTYGKGFCRSFYADPDCVLDLIPADMVINSMLACMAKQAGRRGSLQVYQAGSSVVNPLTLGKIAHYTTEHFRSEPFIDEKGRPIVNPNFNLISNRYLMSIDNFLQFNLPFLTAKLFPWTKEEGTKRRLKYLSYASQRTEQLISTYSAYTFYRGKFDMSNLHKLYEEMSPEEREEFGFAVWTIKWDEYMKSVHLPGLRKYSLHGSNKSSKK